MKGTGLVIVWGMSSGDKVFQGLLGLVNVVDVLKESGEVLVSTLISKRVLGIFASLLYHESLLIHRK